MDLLGSESSDDGEKISFKINQNYAKNYDTWRKKEERQKLIDKYGDVDSSDSSSEEGEIRSTPQMDKDWLRAYAVVRFQQPKLYKKGEKFFHDEAKPVAKHKEKATTLKDHERKFILEKGGVESDDESKPQEPQGKSYFEEQEEIKKSFKDVVEESSDEDTGEDLLVKKQKTTEEQKREENEYLEWLKGERTELEDKEAAEELAPLKAYWNDPSLSEKERVLRDYILNNGYMDQEDSDEEVDEDDAGDDEDDAPNFDVEEEFLEKAEIYEHKYNFRHEEPGADEIKSYPRVIETSVRTKDTRRAEKRKRKLEKKNVERDQRRDEIRLLQKLQREEKMEKLETLRKIANKPDLEYDLEADFDPNEHNKIMQKFFNEDYYGSEKDAVEKPTFEYDAAVDDEPDDWWQSRLKEKGQGDEEVQETAHESSKNKGQMKDSDNEDLADEPYADDPNFIMDADYDPETDYKSQKKKNKKSSKKLAKKLPLFDPTIKTFDEYIDEYLKDKIDKLPFTYREVVPNDFGLSTEEILKANEKELNTWVSVKKMSVYRSRQEELVDKRKFLARSANPEKKRNMLPSLFEKPGEPAGDGDAKKKKKKKKKAVDNEVAVTQSPTSEEVAETSVKTTTSESGLKVGGQISEKLASKAKKRKLVDVHNEIGVSQSPTSEKVAETSVKTTISESGLKVGGQISEKLAAKAKKRKLVDVNNVDLDTLENVSIINTGDSKGGQSAKKKKKQKNVFNNTATRITSSDQKELVEEIRNNNEQTDKSNTNSDKVVKKSIVSSNNKPKKKKKKLNQQTANTNQDMVSINSGGVKKIGKKHKKKKMSISNFSSKTVSDKDTNTQDKKQLKKQLMKVMSAARLSKYGIGPNAAKSVGKKKRKKKLKVQQNSSSVQS